METTATVAPEVIAEVVRKLSAFKGCRFVATSYCSIESGEKSDITIAFGAITENLYEKDVIALRAMLPTLEGVSAEVAQELLDSRLESLAKGVGHNSAYTQQDTWVTIPGLPGIRVHKETGSVNIAGLVIRKVVLQAGTYKPDTRRPRTVAKDAIRHQLPSSKFRTYRIDHMGTLRANGETLEVQNLDAI